MVAIQAIETLYHGHRFRSRLEARWAVLFEALGIPYEYEPEGFELPSGRYLPDFRLDFGEEWPCSRVWIEIKGQEPTDRERFLAVQLYERGAEDVFISVGLPGGEMELACDGDNGYGLPGGFIICRCGRPVLVSCSAWVDKSPYWRDLQSLNGVTDYDQCRDHARRLRPTISIAGAALLAKAARFEYEAQDLTQ